MLEELKKDFFINLVINNVYKHRRWKNNQCLKLKIENTKIENYDTFEEKIWSFLNQQKIRPKCYCGKNTNLITIKDGFRKTCSVKCAANDHDRKEKIKQTELIRYGGPHTQNSDFKRMIKEKYPVIPGSFGSKDHKKAIKEKYGVDNVFQAENIKEKIKQTNLEKYGVENPRQNNDINNRIEQTNLKLYGHKAPLGSKEIQDKIKQSNLENFGFENPHQRPDIKEKINQTNLKRYGHISPFGSKEIQNKIKATNLERYGVEYPLQNAEIFHKSNDNRLKSAYKYKEMIMPSGKIVKYQGYEKYVINYLLDNDVKEPDLILDRIEIPTIVYEFENKSRIYFPDMYVKSKNMLIEVKSTYTFNKDVEKNIAKHLASKKAGYHHIIIVWDPRKNCIYEVINL